MQLQTLYRLGQVSLVKGQAWEMYCPGGSIRTLQACFEKLFRANEGLFLLLAQSAQLFLRTCVLSHTPTDGVNRIFS